MTEPTRAELDRLRDEAFDAIATFTQSQQDFDPDMDAHDNATACLDAYGDARQALGERIGREAEPACAGCGSGSLANPTRAELEAAVEQAGRFLRRECERFVERHRPYDLAAAMRAYRAACQALGEFDGREAEIRRHHADFERWEAMAAKALPRADNQVPS